MPETSVRRGALARSRLDSRRIDFHRPIREPDIPRWLLQSRWAPSTVHRAVRSPTTEETVTRFSGSKQRGCVATTLLLLRVALTLRRLPVELHLGTGNGVHAAKWRPRNRLRRCFYPDLDGPHTPRHRALGLLELETKRSHGLDQGPPTVFSREGKSQRAAPEVPCFPETSPKGTEPERAYSLLLDAFASAALECL